MCALSHEKVLDMTTGMFNQQDYAKIQHRSRLSADVIMPLVLQQTAARSVVDVGCGVGTWLAACAALGISDYLGIDGHHAAEVLQIPREHFRAADLRTPLTLGRWFDLAVSVEVAEHLPPEAGPAFVQQLTRAAPIVVFSAAIPGQGGTGHLHECWQSYWAGLFAQHDYFPVDTLRPLIWDRDDVEVWYRQNILLYIHRDRLPASYVSPGPLDVVHPVLFTRCVGSLRGALQEQLSGRRALSVIATRLRQRLFGHGE